MNLSDRMKLPAAAGQWKQRAYDLLRRRPRAFWLWLAAIAIISEVCLFFMYRIAVVVPETLGREAFYHGQRVTVDLSSGEVVGGSQSEFPAVPAMPVQGEKGARPLNSA